MRSASAMLHKALGAPRMTLRDEDNNELVIDLSEPARCWVCGDESVRAMDRKKWLGANFVGQNRVRCWSSMHVCEPCLCVMSWTTPAVMEVPGLDKEKAAAARAKRVEEARKAGKKIGEARAAVWRNYSVLYDDGKVTVASKGEKPKLREWLRSKKRGNWWAALAESGQKHVVPWAPVQPADARPGRVLFEERELSLGDWTMLDDVTALLTAGASKEELGAADYRPETWMRCGSTINGFEARWASERASAWFDLVLWLAQRDEEAVAARLAAEKEKKNVSRRTKETGRRGPRGRTTASDPSGIPGEPTGERPAALGSATGPSPSSSQDNGNGRGICDVAPSGPAPVGSVKGQLSLFDGPGVGDSRRKRRP